jgi:hypothetical protein
MRPLQPTSSIQGRSFAAFVTALVADLTPTAKVADLAATGQHDSMANTFTAGRIAVLIND